MYTARPAVGNLFNPGPQSLTGTFDPVLRDPRSCPTGAGTSRLSRRPASRGRRAPMARSSSGCWVATSRCCGAAIPSGDSPCRSSSSGTLAPRLAERSSRISVQVPVLTAAPGRFSPGSIALGQARLAAAIMRQLIRSAVSRLQPGAVRRRRPLDGINLPTAALSQA